jgi:hypothetical protein
MAAYTTSLAPQLNKVPEDSEAGPITPLQAGMIGGHEFNMQISQPTQPHTQSLSSNTPPLPAPVPRNSLSANRPRPMSMPPQTYMMAVGTGAGSTTSSSDAKERPQLAADDNVQPKKTHRDGSHTPKPSRSNRILGDYTLSKTLGAGSMGKVKLATHNVTGEKVRFFLISLLLLMSVCSSQSKFYHESTPPCPTRMAPTRNPLQNKPRKMPLRKSAPSAKQRFPCFSTTRISVACVK